jgi:hypothetical protein
MASFKMLEVKTVEKNGDRLESTFKHFFHFRAYSFQVEGDIFSLILPKKTEITLTSAQLAGLFRISG